MPPRIIVFGAGGHAKVVVDALELCGSLPESIYDDDACLHGKPYAGYPVRGGRTELFTRRDEGRAVVVAIARNEVRHRLVQEFVERGFPLQGVRHPAAVVSPRADVAPTAQLMAGVVVNAGAKVGSHAVLNTGCIVEHDSQIGDFAHIGPGATLAGAVEVAEGGFVGSGACVRPIAKIGAWATVGAGSVVVDDVPEGKTVVGVPARVVR